MNVDRSSTTMQMDAKYKAVKQSRCMTRVITALRFPINKTVSSTTDREYCRMSAYADVLAQRANLLAESARLGLKRKGREASCRGMQTRNVSTKEDVECCIQNRIGLGGVGSNDADVCNVVALFEGWNRVDVQHNAGDRSADFEDEFAEIVGNKADFHALLNVGATLHQRVPNARAVGQDIHDSVEPHRILDGPRVS